MYCEGGVGVSVGVGPRPPGGGGMYCEGGVGVAVGGLVGKVRNSSGGI